MKSTIISIRANGIAFPVYLLGKSAAAGLGGDSPKNADLIGSILHDQAGIDSDTTGWKLRGARSTTFRCGTAKTARNGFAARDKYENVDYK